MTFFVCAVLILMVHGAAGDECDNGRSCVGNGHCCEIDWSTTICCNPPTDECCTGHDGNIVCGTTKGCSGSLCCLTACCAGSCCPAGQVCCGSTCCDSAAGCDGTACAAGNDCETCTSCAEQCKKECEDKDKETAFTCNQAGGALQTNCKCVSKAIDALADDTWVYVVVGVIALICVASLIKSFCFTKKEVTPAVQTPVTSIRQPLLAPTSVTHDTP